jgi:hypothetical protein
MDLNKLELCLKCRILTIYCFKFIDIVSCVYLYKYIKFIVISFQEQIFNKPTTYKNDAINP